MRQIFLIARREYLAFVTSWGFWVSLLILPLLITLGGAVPMLAQRAQPVRYYAVIAEDPQLEAAYHDWVWSRRNDAYEGVVRAAARLVSADAETEARALAAFAEAETPEDGLKAAAETLGLPAAQRLELPRFPTARIDPPSTEPGELRPYLLGDALVSTPEGPRPLYAAIFLRRDGSEGVAIDYWSAALNNRSLLELAEGAMREHLRVRALARAGVPIEAVERAEALAPAVTELNPEREGAEAQVTLADRLPGIMGVVMAFFLWMSVFSGASFLLNGVVEERGAKILDALMASARPTEFLAGKLFGTAWVTGTLLLVWAGVSILGMLTAARAGASWPQDVIATVIDPALLIPFAAYFVLGYLMFGAIYLAVGSLCDTIQEAQMLMMPMMFVTLPPVFMTSVAITSPDSPVLQVMSWIPFYSPFVMMMRLPSGVPLWEVVATMALTAGFTVLVIWAAGGVFRAGVIGRAGPESWKRLFGRGKPAPAVGSG